MKMRLLWALIVLMAVHLTYLGVALAWCTTRATIGPGCQRFDGTLQKSAETYIAVILALMATPSDAAP